MIGHTRYRDFDEIIYVPEENSILPDIRVGDPLLRAERTVYDVKGNPVEYVSVVYRADKCAFTMKLKRKRTKKSVGWGAF